MKVIDIVNKHLFKVVLICFLGCIIAAFFQLDNLAAILFITFAVTFLFGLLLGLILRGFKVSLKRTIEKGKHYVLPTHFPLRRSKSDSIIINRMFVFNETALYRFNDADDSDKNKLFGITTRWLPVVIKKSTIDYNVHPWFSFLGYYIFKPHHWNSSRVAWNCHNDLNMVTLYKYQYREGIRYSHKVVDIPLNVPVKVVFNFNKIDGEYVIQVEIGAKKHYKYGRIEPGTNRYLLLDLYFGGNKAAPHNITIEESTF